MLPREHGYFRIFFLGQLTLKYYQKIIYFHPFRLWMKKRIQEKVQTQDLWAVKGILTITLVFSFENNVRKNILTINHCAGIVKEI